MEAEEAEKEKPFWEIEKPISPLSLSLSLLLILPALFVVVVIRL